MSYVKQNFEPGQILRAAHLNHIEDGIAAAEQTGGGGSAGIPGAAADGETDDTEALKAALSRSNCVVDGGNKKYKYVLLEIENVENLTVKNVTFYRGEAVNVKGCKNIRFEHCRWEGIRAASAESTTQTCGIRLMERKDADGNEIWSENIWIEGCVFDDIDFNHNINIHAWGPGGNEISGQAILPRSVHKLFIKHNFFTQTKGNAAIHWNSYKKNGYAEVTDNLFYLTGFGGICVYAVQQQFPKVSGKICNNQFIGCGLGYEDPEFLNAKPEKDRGVGCAALLGGAGTSAAPYKWHLAVENNVFEDCCESSIEGPVWNPVIGNYINGQGVIQDEENCRLMEKKYHLDYKLQVRYNPSVNFIYRNYYKDADGTYPMDDDDPMLFANNVMGKSYVNRASFIQIKGDFNCPVVFTGNVMQVDTGSLHTHLLFCTFRRGVRFENNQGFKPYFNQCTVYGDMILDDALSAWGCDFSNANFVPNSSRARFPETRTALYDPGRMVLENSQATAENGYPVLRSYDVPDKIEKPTDAAYDIASASGYTETNGYVFSGPSAPNRIDTGIQLLKDGGDFTIFLKFDGNPTTDITTGESPIMPLFTLYNGAGATNSNNYRLTVGGQWGNVMTTLKSRNSTAVLNRSRLPLKNMQLLVRRTGGKLECWTMEQGADAASLTENYVSYDINETADYFAGFEGNLYIGAPEGYFSDENKYSLWGKMRTFQLFRRALTDNETAMLLYGKVFATGETEEDIPVYDISTDSHYSTEDGAVTFDGSFGIDTGVKLFADRSDFTVICKFRLDNYHDAKLTNFNFIPVLSAMNYDHTDNFKTNSPGFDIGLSMQAGVAMDSIATGGFVTFRNSWKFTNPATILNSYFGYSGQDIGVIVMRKDGVISVYDFDMQRKATLNGADATTVFDGTLRIGANMVAPSLAGDNKLKGKVYECKVYDKALSINALENMFPNLYSNEKRIKGAVRCMVPSLQYTNQVTRYLFLEAMIDMGKYSASEYAGKYPKAVGIRVDGVNETIWCPTGSNTHIKKVYYAPKNIGPYGVISAEIVNSGLAPGLVATVKAFHCAILTEDIGYTDITDAVDFTVEWDKEELAIAVGEKLTGHVTYLPESTNTSTRLTVTTTGDAATAEFADNMITVTGTKNGEATVQAALPSGVKRAFVVKVGTGIADEDPTVAVQSVTLNKSEVTMKAGGMEALTATVLPANATDKTVTWSVTPEGIATLSAETGSSITLTAAAAGSAAVTAKAGEKTAVCAVTVSEADGSETDDVPGESPVYKLAEAKTFVPENKEHIDTGIRMFGTIDPKPDWTILFEVQCGSDTTSVSGTYTLMHCMEESSPWPGLCVQIATNGGGSLRANMYRAANTLEYLTWVKAKQCKFAVRVSGTELKTWSKRYGAATSTISGYDTAVAKNLILGCYQESDGTKGRYFDGTLYQCLVYRKALTDEQIETWVNG